MEASTQQIRQENSSYRLLYNTLLQFEPRSINGNKNHLFKYSPPIQLKNSEMSRDPKYSSDNLVSFVENMPLGDEQKKGLVGLVEFRKQGSAMKDRNWKAINYMERGNGNKAYFGWFYRDPKGVEHTIYVLDGDVKGEEYTILIADTELIEKKSKIKVSYELSNIKTENQGAGSVNTNIFNLVRALMEVIEKKKYKTSCISQPA